MDGSTPSSTAQGVALIRAHLTEEGLLDDPLAAGFLDDRNTRRRGPIRSTVTPTTIGDLLAGAGWSVTVIRTGPDLGRRHLAGTGLTIDGLNPGSALVLAERNQDPTRR